MEPDKFLSALRGAHVDMEWLFTQGQCYNLFLIMKTIWPQSIAHYSGIEGHVYVEVDGKFYDIRGRHFITPKDLLVLDHNRSDKPHRWGGRDLRRLMDDARKRNNHLHIE